MDKEKLAKKTTAQEYKAGKQSSTSEEADEEARRLQLSKASLEAKAKLYERLCRGEELFGMNVQLA